MKYKGAFGVRHTQKFAKICVEILEVTAAINFQCEITVDFFTSHSILVVKTAPVRARTLVQAGARARTFGKKRARVKLDSLKRRRRDCVSSAGAPSTGASDVHLTKRALRVTLSGVPPPLLSFKRKLRVYNR